MHVAPYTPEHFEELCAVCLATASERARTDKVHGRFTRLMYCEPYLEQGTAYMLLDEEGVARGYALSADDFDAWKVTFEPYREQIAALGPEYQRRADEELAYYESVASEYPAHLHIDIEEAYTGHGNGRMLMEALLDHFRETGIRGVSFGTALSNTRAVGFYEHLGFQHLTEYEDGGITFCMRFD